MVTENGDQGFLLKMDSVGPELHQISPNKFCSVYNTHTIVLQCYVYYFEVLCSSNGRRNVLAVFVTKCHEDFQTPRAAISVADFYKRCQLSKRQTVTNKTLLNRRSGPSGPSGT
jgi:hypothetical protein